MSTESPEQKHKSVYVVMGASGNTGSVAVRELLAADLKDTVIRAVVRDESKGEEFKRRGAEIAVVADQLDVKALTKAFTGATAVYVMMAPNWDVNPDLAEGKGRVAALHDALVATRPSRIVALSSVGVQVEQFNLLTPLHLFEAMLRTLIVPRDVVILRPGWFIENHVRDIEGARKGEFYSYIRPNVILPMIATADIGPHIARTLRVEPDAITSSIVLPPSSSGPTPTVSTIHIVEMAGPDASPNDIAVEFARIFGHPVKAIQPPRDQWDTIFQAYGMKHPLAYSRMNDGWNEGWVGWESSKIVKCPTGIAPVLTSLVEQSNAAKAKQTGQ